MANRMVEPFGFHQLTVSREKLVYTQLKEALKGSISKNNARADGGGGVRTRGCWMLDVG